MLADQDIEDDAVDGVVRAVPGDDPHLGLLLPEAVHPALALLVAGGVPGEVVVQDGIEVLLEVDAFGEAVGAHEHEPAAPGGEESDACLALGMRSRPVTGSTRTSFASAARRCRATYSAVSMKRQKTTGWKPSPRSA